MAKMEEIKALTDRIVRAFHPDRIVLFGSYASGTPNSDSDVDLLVVLPFEGKNWLGACSEAIACAVPSMVLVSRSITSGFDP